MKKYLLILSTCAIFTSASAQNWTTLFDGNGIKGWHSWKKFDIKGWHVMGGVLMTHGGNGDLVTDKEYGDFELEFEFKAAPKGNSGVIYKVIERDDLGATYTSGAEYQIIDDKNYPDQIKDVQKTAANYDIQPANDLTIVKPAGEWNTGRIIIKNNHIEHWLNGVKVVEYEYGNDKWKADVVKSKFATWEYAKPHAKGKIALQDHGDMVSFRNIRIKEL